MKRPEVPTSYLVMLPRFRTPELWQCVTEHNDPDRLLAAFSPAVPPDVARQCSELLCDLLRDTPGCLRGLADKGAVHVLWASTDPAESGPRVTE